ncbi:electron transfer flavoprotein subunit beta [Leeia aquatica]|uniref:Electron transfer flavoprotein subunit beta n=1 Tax=Leeia aquatica TaxID=2725557 RepID=A0A847S263_9NEIS|nr:electron transfer flavoprotein subunit beta [Leeia aquatica]NLR73853.1 electron transfer flavoprotein subunit beta [Leeia aquatica]
MSGVKLTVLVSPGRHPVSGRARVSPADAAALCQARELPGTQLRVMSAGQGKTADLDAYLGLGVAELEWIPTADERVAETLQAALAGQELVLMGSRADGGLSSGMLPFQLAAALGMPVIQDVLQVSLRGRTARVVQFLPKGLRRELEVDLPALITLHPRAHGTTRYAYALARAGRVVQCHGFVVSVSEQCWQVEPANRRARPLKAQLKLSGHARMQGAIASDEGGRAGQVVKQGTVVEKAQVVLDYLREHRLIDF